MAKLGRTATLAGLLVIACVGVLWGATRIPGVQRALGLRISGEEPAGPEASAEIAERTLDRVERLRAGTAGDRLALTGSELTSIVRFALPGIVPPGVASPTVELSGDDVHLSARLAVDAFPRLPDLGEVVGLLPDTVRIDLSGALEPLDQEYVTLVVERIEVAHVPLPRRLVGRVLNGLGADRGGATPRDGLRLPLPDGLERAYVQADRLVLVARAVPTQAVEPGS